MKRIALLLLALPLALSIAIAGAKPPAKTLPPYFTLPPSVTIANPDSMYVEDFGESDFYNHGSDEPVTKQGKHWQAPLILANPPANIDGKGVWALIKPSLAKSGWTFPDEYDSNPFSVMMRYQKDGKDVWAYLKIFGFDDMRLNIVEVAPPKADFATPPPAATPEKVSATKGDFPYLPPLPGSKFGTSSQQAGPMTVTLPGSDEEQLVGTGSITKYYGQPPGLSNVYFVTAYHTALVKAGWTIISENHGGDATLTAHYAKNGRDIWAYLHNGGEEYSIKVADAGASGDLAKTLAKDCHVALYGVLFDFNKASLKQESDSVLQSVLALLQKDAALKLEVQGHTDNVGGDDYNQKLSEARAKSVMAWLTSHGIAPARLSFKGFGKTVPVATNDTDDGRAKNRRVEIAKPGCKK